VISSAVAPLIKARTTVSNVTRVPPTRATPFLLSVIGRGMGCICRVVAMRLFYSKSYMTVIVAQHPIQHGQTQPLQLPLERPFQHRHIHLWADALCSKTPQHGALPFSSQVLIVFFHFLDIFYREIPVVSSIRGKTFSRHLNGFFYCGKGLYVS
jgi:hypothetical protein